MDWLQSFDTALFRVINQQFSHPFLDSWMPWLSGNAFFVPLVVAAALGLIWKGGTRGRLFVIFVLLAVAIGDGLICNAIKDALGRARPYETVADANVLVGRGKSGSLPSAHTANWFAAATVAFVFYRRSLWFMLPMAALIGFSRVYLGVHYPSDVLAGAVLGVAYASGIVWLVDRIWRAAGRRWFPLWWARVPSLIQPPTPGSIRETAYDLPSATSEPESADGHWLRFGYFIIGLLLLLRLGYLASGTIELSEDEAYQWLWSKHPALSYYSKPPLIAYTQYLGTHLWGDNAFGVRFFSPVIAAVISLSVLRFMAREVSARVGFWLVLIMTAAPLTSAGAVLMTIDPLSVLFWTLAMLSGWRAARRGSTSDWIWTGLWMGLGFLSKYTALFQLLCWAVFFFLCPSARQQLRRPGPYLALLILAICTLPVIVWNYQNGWITVTHLANRGGLDREWNFTLRYLSEFLAAEAGLLNPIFFAGMIAAAISFWRRDAKDPLLVYLFSMGAPLFLCYLLYTFRARVQPNWIAPAVVPLFCLMAIYWARRLGGGLTWVKRALTAGLILGITAVILFHDTDLIRRIAGRYLPAKVDPLRRVRGWADTAKLVGEARRRLLEEGKPVFIIGDHYGITGLISFYLPEAKQAVRQTPLVYYETSELPKNQFYFWPGYTTRKGENAIYVMQIKAAADPPPFLIREFETVENLGIYPITYRGRVFRTIQLFACRNLR